MKTLKIIVKGIVQRVGYRNNVYRIAKTLKVKGYVKNLDDPDESVEIVAQQEENILNEFLKLIKINDDVTEVNEIEKEEIKPGNYKKFEISRGSYDEENAERLDVAAIHLYNLSKKMDSMNGKLDTFHGDTTKRFDVMENKYGKISVTLDSISHSLEELVKILKTFSQNK